MTTFIMRTALAVSAWKHSIRLEGKYNILSHILNRVPVMQRRVTLITTGCKYFAFKRCNPNDLWKDKK